MTKLVDYKRSRWIDLKFDKKILNLTHKAALLGLSMGQILRLCDLQVDWSF